MFRSASLSLKSANEVKSELGGLTVGIVGIEPGAAGATGAVVPDDGPGAGELIAEGVLAVEMGALASDVALSIHPHPTLSETIMEAAEVYFGQSTHVYRPKRD